MANIVHKHHICVFILVHLQSFRFDNNLLTTVSKIICFRLGFSKGNTNQSLKRRAEETAGVLQLGTKMTKMANKHLILK